MGLEVEFAVKIATDSNILELSKTLLHTFKDSRLFDYLVRIEVRKDEYIAYLKPDLRLEKIVNIDQAEQIMLDYCQQCDQEKIMIVLWWSAKRYGKSKIGGIVESPNRAIINIVGKDSYFPSAHNNQANLVYEVGDAKDYTWYIYGDEVASKNLEELLKEIRLIADAGALSIKCVDMESSGDPRRNYLCFHRHLDSYIEDIKSFYPIADIESISEDDLLNAVLQSEDIDFVEAEAGLVIYHKKFVTANLTQFYEKLALIVSADHNGKQN